MGRMMNCLICGRSIDKFDPAYNGCPELCPFTNQPEQLINDPATIEAPPTPEQSEEDAPGSDIPPAPQVIDGGGVTL